VLFLEAKSKADNVYYVKSARGTPSGLRKAPHSVVGPVTARKSDFYDGGVFIPLSQAVAQAHRRLLPDEPYQDLRTLQAIALALTDLIPLYWQDARTGERHELIAPELAAATFTPAAMKMLCVPKRRFEAALATMQVTSLDQARVSLTLRQSPRSGLTP